MGSAGETGKALGTGQRGGCAVDVRGLLSVQASVKGEPDGVMGGGYVRWSIGAIIGAPSQGKKRSA